MESYKEVIKEVAETVLHIRVPKEHMKKKGKKIKDTKLTKFHQEILDTTTEALNQLHIGDLDALPKSQLVRVVKALIALGKQYNNQIQNDFL